uniref:Nucleotid_trans domain-containing protein n=1 Tax=Caenorhabditis tropicalis TaxID=1561998 RepID=A0A1I7T8R7_9PELO
MRAFQRYSVIGLGIFVLFVIFIEEWKIGKSRIYLANLHNYEVIRNITVQRKDKKVNIGIVIVLQKTENEQEYRMALDTVRCYGRYFKYDVHVIHVDKEPDISEKCPQKDFMFRRHCILSLKLPSISNTWLLFLDGDMGVINPNHLIETYIPTDSKTDVVFYSRIMNHEVMAGSYLIRNTEWSRKFLMFWANFENKLPKSFHGSDNGAIHSVIMYYGVPELTQKREFCEKTFWETATDYESLSLFEVCAREIIRNGTFSEIKILPKGRLAWARDGWLTNSVWSESDFIFHGWQRKRHDKLVFAMWHSPLVYDDRWNLTKCATEEANQNWKYKDTFIGNTIDVDRQLFVKIQEQQQSYAKHFELFKKLYKSL